MLNPVGFVVTYMPFLISLGRCITNLLSRNKMFVFLVFFLNYMKLCF